MSVPVGTHSDMCMCKRAVQQMVWGEYKSWKTEQDVYKEKLPNEQVFDW